MKQTAVNWLIEKMIYSGIGICKEWREQAKQLEKQQIIDAHISGYDSSGESAKDYYDFYYGSKGSDELHEHNLDEITTSSQTEISDEEIEKAFTIGTNQKTEYTHKIEGVKWYREQLKQRQ